METCVQVDRKWPHRGIRGRPARSGSRQGPQRCSEWSPWGSWRVLQDRQRSEVTHDWYTIITLPSLFLSSLWLLLQFLSPPSLQVSSDSFSFTSAHLSSISHLLLCPRLTWEPQYLYWPFVPLSPAWCFLPVILDSGPFVFVFGILLFACPPGPPPVCRPQPSVSCLFRAWT